jgi:hypothetical protein
MPETSSIPQPLHALPQQIDAADDAAGKAEQ